MDTPLHGELLECACMLVQHLLIKFLPEYTVKINEDEKEILKPKQSGEDVIGPC